MDKDNTGMISAEELEEAMREMNMEMGANQIRTIIQNIDYQGNGKINYSEFLAATVSCRTVLTNEMLWALFKHFDTDDSGYITPENIREAMEKAGKKISDTEMKEVMREHDIEKNGLISFEEFKQMFRGFDVIGQREM